MGPRQSGKGNVEAGFRQADAVVEATYVTQVQTHTALETHGLVAYWDGEDLDGLGLDPGHLLGARRARRDA